MKRIICSFWILSLFAAGLVSAQQQQPATAAASDSSITAFDSKKEVYVKENIPFKSPIPYSYVREADVTFEKTVWRVIDLRQKQNLPLYFPIAPIRKIGTRVNFFTLLMEGLERGEITAYHAFPTSDEFASSQIQTYDQIIGNPSLKTEDKSVASISPFTGADTTILEKGKDVLQDEEVVKLIIKEKWFFDRRHSRLDKQVIGIQPVFIYHELIEGSDETRARIIPVMWVYYPEIRPLLARHAVYNDFNDAQNISYDDFFMQHRYHGLIEKMSNVHNNRYISEYQKGVDVLLEAVRLENDIFDWEQDLWEY